MLVLAALGADPQFGWAKRAGEGVARSASQSAEVTQLHQEIGPNNVLGREMDRVRDYIKVGHREKDRGRANKGGRHQEPARRGGNDRGRSQSPARLRRRQEPAARSHGRPQADDQGVFVNAPAHKRHPGAADGGYQKSALKQKHAPALHLDRSIAGGKPAGEYDLDTNTYAAPAPAGEGEQQPAPAAATPAAAEPAAVVAPVVPAAAAGLLGEEQLKSLGALQRAAGEKMRLMGEAAPQQQGQQKGQQQGQQQGKQQEAPAAAQQKLEAQKQEAQQAAEALQPMLAPELQPPGGKLSIRPEAADGGEWKPPAGGKPAGEFDLETRSFTTAGETAAAAAPAFGEHEHGTLFQEVNAKLKAETNATQPPQANSTKEKMGADEKSKLLGERGAASMVATSLENATTLAQGVQRSFGSAQRELTTDLHSLEAGGRLTQANANDAVRNWLSSSHGPVTSATAGIKGAPGMVAASGASDSSAVPWYQRFGPFDTSM